MNTSQKIFLARHGETAWTLSGQHTGLTDVPLTENGRVQAELLGKVIRGLSLQKAYVSPLLRANETFEIAHLSTPAEFDDNLVEWNYGAYEGLSSKEIHKSDPNWSVFLQGGPQGESVADVSARAGRVISRVQGSHGNIILFSSGHILRAIAARWLGLPLSFGRHIALSPASLSILGYEHGAPAILLWNSTAHLSNC